MQKLKYNIQNEKSSEQDLNLLIDQLLKESELIRVNSCETFREKNKPYDLKNMEIFSKILTNRLKKLWIQNLRGWICHNQIEI